MDPQPVIRWQLNKERRFPFGRSPDPTWFEPIGFPPPWPDRPRLPFSMATPTFTRDGRTPPAPAPTDPSSTGPDVARVAES